MTFITNEKAWGVEMAKEKLAFCGRGIVEVPLFIKRE